MTTTLTTLREADGGPLLVRPAEVPPIAPRLVALAVDQLLVVVGCLVTTVVWLAFGGSGRELIVVWLFTGLLVETVQAFAEAISGATLGGALTHVRTVSARTGWPAGLVAVVLRRLVQTAAGVLLPVVGAYVVAGSGWWDRSPARRGWHDWAADTLVLRAWAVPDQDARAAERECRQAARLAGTSVPHADESSSEAVGGPVQDLDRADELVSGLDSADRLTSEAAPSGDELVSGLGSAEEPTSDTHVADGRAGGSKSGEDPTAVDDAEPLDHRTATTLDVRSAEDRAPSGPDGEAGQAGESALGTTSVVPIVVPDLRPETEPEHPQARHRATVLGLGRPRSHTPSGRHRVPEVPTQRTQPRVSGAWPQLEDDEPTGRTGGGLRLIFDSGVRIEVVGNGAVGRDLSGIQPPPLHAVVVDDPKRTVSRVHLRFGPNPGQAALWVMDENSTNGTILVGPDGGARVLPAGVPAVVGAGWQIRFGERSAVVERSLLRTSTPSTDPVERVASFGRDSALPSDLRASAAAL